MVDTPDSPSSVETSMAIVRSTSLALFMRRLLISSSNPSMAERSSIADDEIDSMQKEIDAEPAPEGEEEF